MVAKKLLARREGDIAKGKVPAINFEKVTFDELVQDFIMDYEINEKKSIERARISVRHLEKEFKGVHVPAITTQRIQGDYIQSRKKWLCETVMNNSISGLMPVVLHAEARNSKKGQPMPLSTGNWQR